MEIQITDFNQQGQGVGRLDGQVVFVEGAIPGDRVSLGAIRSHGQYAVAELDRVMSPSPDRVEPFCPLADRCGGCTLQPMQYSAQLIHKRQQVVELLSRIGHLPAAQERVLPTLGMSRPDHYRCKVQFPVRGTSDQPLIGFYERRSHTVVDGTACPIGHPASDVVRSRVRDYIRRFSIAPYQEEAHTGSLRHLVVRIGRQTGEVLVILVSRTSDLPGTDWLAAQLKADLAAFSTPLQPGLSFQLSSLVLSHQPNRTNVILGPTVRILSGQDSIRESLLGLDFQISPLSFFQVNPEQTEKLYQAAVEMAGLGPDDQGLDLYCGTGTIALVLAQTAGSVIGVESVGPAVHDARDNARRNGIDNVRFETARAEAWLPEAVRMGSIHPVAAVIDPPRRGCDDALLDALKAVPLQRLVYVSCNPATLARDINRLKPEYEVERVQPVDLFPWTDAIECVCLLTRTSLSPV